MNVNEEEEEVKDKEDDIKLNKRNVHSPKKNSLG
jgi:hypothetical protein